MKQLNFKDVQNLIGGEEISISDKYVFIQEDTKDGETIVWGFGESTESALADAQKSINKWNLFAERKDINYARGVNEPPADRPEKVSLEKCELCEVVLGTYMKKIEVIVFSENEIPDNLNIAVNLDDDINDTILFID